MSNINQENRDRKYNEWARRNPAIVSIVFPLLVAVYFFQKNSVELSDVRYIVGAILSFGSIIPALFFFYQSSIREFSILFVEKPLFRILGRPSSNLMMKKNSVLSTQRKERIINKAKSQGIELFYPDEDKLKSRSEKTRIMREAFEVIREVYRDNPIVFEFNCTYGFFRNLSGGLIVDLLICLGLCIINCVNKSNMGHSIGTCAIILGSLFVFCLICTYYSRERYVQRVYVLFDN